jgi:hypothetical protein
MCLNYFKNSYFHKNVILIYAVQLKHVRVLTVFNQYKKINYMHLDDDLHLVLLLSFP